jgi:hypothetical protein
MVKVIQPKTELPPHNPLISGLIKKYTAALLLPANTPPDITMNVCGTSATLTPVFPPTGYNNNTLIWNDGSTQPTLNVTSSGTYWWQVTGPSVVNNGDFTAGITGFTSNYTNVTTTTPNGTQLVPEAAYAVGTNPKSYHSSFYTYGDHTNGSGNMLIVNGASGAAAANVPVWSENITVAANTNYVFSVWVRSASLTSPAILQFSINGTPLGGTITPTSTAATSAWQFFTATWNSGAVSGNVPISLVNQNIAANGNDFAIDDIVFAPVYRQNIIVNLNPIPVLSVIGQICGVPTYDLTQTIVGYAPNTYTYTFKDGGGNILSGNQITSAPIGTYTITATNAAGCTSNPQNTTVNINPVPTLSVTSPVAGCVSYDLKNAINGYDATTYTYTYKNGATTLGSSVVTATGTYTITATNNATGCVSNPQNVNVTINPLPTFTTTSPTLACGTASYNLSTAISGAGGAYTYTYQDSGGNTLGSSTVTTSGTYTITATSAAGCTTTHTVAVSFNPIPVVAVVGTVCIASGSTYDLRTAVIGYDPSTYTYVFKNGGGTTLNPTGGSNNFTKVGTGNYTVTAMSAAGCTSAQQTIIVKLGTPPTFTVTSPTLLCGVTSYDLSTAISGGVVGTSYTYMDSGGNTLGSSTVTTSGSYYIIATTTGGCQSVQSINVTFKPTPTFTATSPTLACGVTSYDLSTAISGAGGAYTYTYKDSGGNPLASPPTVSVSGNYTITATNSTTGCVSTPQTVTVTLKPIPVLTVTSPPAQCGGTFNLSSAINSPDATVTYTYSSGASSVVSTSGAYIITATKNGCSTTATVNVTINPIPVLTVTSPPAQCGGTFDLSSAINSPDATVTYTYKDSGGNTLASSIVSTSGAYTITATKNGCSTTATVNVTINPIPVLSVTSPPAQCGGTFNLSSAINSPDATVTYTYSSGASSVVSTSGAYIITATKNGCSTTATVNVTINPIPVLSVTSPPAQCGGTYDLKSAITNYDNTGTYAYTYKNGATPLASSIVSTSGNYTVVETNNSTNCQSTAPVTVTINPIPVLALTSPHTACVTYDLTQTIVGGYDPTTYNYVFKDPSGNVITLANAQAITQSGTYTITEQNIITGCTSLPQPTTVTISPYPPKPDITINTP